MASTILAKISRKDLQDLSPPPLASITDVKQLSSYNWIEAPTPTIAVPGSPPLWSAPSTPRQLKKDSGLIYIAQNAARHPDSPLEPLFRALYIANPSFDIRSVDVVTDRNNVRKLLSFVNPDLAKKDRDTFTINVEVAKNTAIFSRTETATQEFIGPNQNRGFGHEFEKTYTTNEISGSTGHHRIISYRFSDLNIVIRHETDGYVGAGVGTPSSNSKGPESDSLSAMLGSLSLSSTSSIPNPASTVSKLTVVEKGRVIPLDSTLEIKTRVTFRPLKIPDVAPQLWLSQTPKLVRAYHNKGRFESPEVEDVAAPIKEWETHNQPDLRKLAVLISRIRNVVKGCGGTAAVRYDVKEDKLIISKVDGRKMLPEDLYSKWGDNDDPKAVTDTGSNAGSESFLNPVDGVETRKEGKSIVSGPGHTKAKKNAEAAKEEEQTLPDDLLPSPTLTKDKDSGS